MTGWVISGTKRIKAGTPVIILDINDNMVLVRNVKYEKFWLNIYRLTIKWN